MRIVDLEWGGRSSKIYIGEKLENLEEYLKGYSKVVIVTDSNVYNFYKDDIDKFENIIVLGSGEGIKSLETIENIYRRFIDFDLDRSSFIVGVGGGVVTDITGFVASTFLRGVKFGFVATTLLAMVDGSIGGKNGFNFSGLKNYIGSFNLPHFVIDDISTLNTLEDREYLNGVVEMIKHGLISSRSHFNAIRDNREGIVDRERSLLEDIIYASVKIKVDLVSKDFSEGDDRKKLNFGHTFGHAVELIEGWSHGEAVSIGMVKGCKVSYHLNLLSKDESESIVDLLKSFNLPISTNKSIDQLFEILKKDKKRDGEYIDFITLRSIGRSEITPILYKDLESYLLKS